MVQYRCWMGCVFFVVATEVDELRCVFFGVVFDVPDETMLQSYEYKVFETSRIAINSVLCLEICENV